MMASGSWLRWANRKPQCAGRFDEQAAVDQLRAVQYSAVQGTILISELLRRLSRRAGGS
jgi:hypothetical protein